MKLKLGVTHGAECYKYHRGCLEQRVARIESARWHAVNPDYQNGLSAALAILAGIIVVEVGE